VSISRVDAAVGDVEAYRELRIKLWPMIDEENRRETAQQLAAPEKWAVFLAQDDSGRSLGFVEVRLREYAEGETTSRSDFLRVGTYSPKRVGEASVGDWWRPGKKWARTMGCTEMASNTEIWRTESIEAHLRLGYSETERDVNFLKRLS
jgi:aminoglycoside 6'-N-acetyltransferase I